MMNLGGLINESGESILKNYNYVGGVLTIVLYLDELERHVEVVIKTDCVSINSFYLNKEEDLYRTCRIEVEELLKVLSVENGFYVPAKTFDKVMKESRFDYNLAYGKKVSDIKYIFSLVGYGRLITCLISDLNGVEFLEGTD